MIEGNYDLNGQRMQSYNRIVFASGTPARPGIPGQIYLVQLTVTGVRRQGAERRAGHRGHHQGFTVAAK